MRAVENVGLSDCATNLFEEPKHQKVLEAPGRALQLIAEDGL